MSPAVRTYATAHVLRRLAGLPMGGLLLDERLYESCGHNLLSLLQRLDDVDDEVTLVGHSPGLEELAQLLCQDYRQPLGTGELVALELDVEEWRACRADCARLLLHVASHE